MAIKNDQKSSENFFCEKCDYTTSRKSQYDRHILTLKHKKSPKTINDYKKVPKVPKVPDILDTDIFHCDKCDYTTSRKSHYDRHILTLTHLSSKKAPKAPKGQKSSEHICKKCDKSYKHYSSLWKHNKTCTVQNDPIDKDLLMVLIKQNADLMSIIKNGTNNTNITNTNSHNKTFNLQFFLNEQCKDALNITDFVSSIKPQLSDLETTGRLGYVEGISRIINKGLKDLDTFKRPIHCSDLKRETLYIKTNNEWQKENENKEVLTKAIKHVANENIRQIGEWKKEHPNCTDSDSKKNTLYLNIVSNAMSGVTCEEQAKNYEKIISNIAKEVVIEK